LGGFALNYKRLGNKKMLTYSKIVKPLARELRNNQTDAEVLLWSRIRRKQILGVQFNRQKPIDRYIVDFYSASTKLVIELDGIQHYEIDAIEYDFERTKTLESFGLKVMRFDNSLIFSELDNVISIIYDEVKNRISC
jgi:very-short-patch-repair endonuclease